MQTRLMGETTKKDIIDMRTRLRGKFSLLFFTFVVVMLIFPAMAFAQDAGDSTGSSSPAPTI
jgi:hypothetical protein